MEVKCKGKNRILLELSKQETYFLYDLIDLWLTTEEVILTSGGRKSLSKAGAETEISKTLSEMRDKLDALPFQ